MDALTLEEARQLFTYNKKTGLLFSNSDIPLRRKGAVLGNIRGDGALAVSVKGQTLLVHRLVWLLHYGKWPEGYVTHKNGDKTDNRIDNLECLTPYTDIRAVKEIAGVSFVKKTKRWKAVIHHRGRQYYLGEYEEKTDAVLARLSAEQCLGLHINHKKSARQWIERNL